MIESHSKISKILGSRPNVSSKDDVDPVVQDTPKLTPEPTNELLKAFLNQKKAEPTPK